MWRPPDKPPTTSFSNALPGRTYDTKPFGREAGILIIKDKNKLDKNALQEIVIARYRASETAKDVLNRKVPAAGTPAAASPMLRFLRLKKRKQVRASYFGWKNRYLLPVSLRYIPGFIFWVGKQVPATGHAIGTRRASYFR